MTRTLLLITAVLAASSTAALAQEAGAGGQSFREWPPCPSVGGGGRNKGGRELNGRGGRKPGTADGYNYSEANKNSGITWGEAEFKDYIKDPRAKIQGTKMVFAGIKNEKKVNDLWAYLKQFGPDGKTK